MSKDLVIKVGEYTNKDNEVKGEYVKLGVVLSGENGSYVLIDPTVSLAGCLIKQRILNGKQKKKPGDMLMVSIFDRNKDNQQQNDSAPQQQQQSQPASSGADNTYDDDIPFS